MATKTSPGGKPDTRKRKRAEVTDHGRTRIPRKSAAENEHWSAEAEELGTLLKNLMLTCEASQTDRHLREAAIVELAGKTLVDHAQGDAEQTKLLALLIAETMLLCGLECGATKGIAHYKDTLKPYVRRNAERPGLKGGRPRDLVVAERRKWVHDFYIEGKSIYWIAWFVARAWGPSRGEPKVTKYQWAKKLIQNRYQRRVRKDLEWIREHKDEYGDADIDQVRELMKETSVIAMTRR